MLKLKFAVALLASVFGCVYAQAQIAAPLQSGNISASSTNCATSFSCVWESVLPQNAGTTTINLSGTFTATLLVEESNNGGQSWSIAATLSAAGTTTYSTNGFTDIRVRCSAYTSGTAVVTISTGLLQVQGAGTPCPATGQLIPFSATPVFVYNQGCAENTFVMTMTGNITSMTISGTVPQWADARIQLTQDATGGRTFVCPTNLASTLQCPTGVLTPTTGGASFTLECVSSGGCSNNTGSWQNTDYGPTGALPATPATPNGATAVLDCPISAGTCNAAWGFLGNTPRAITGTTANDTIQTSDNGSRVDYQGSVSVNPVTIPTCTTLGFPATSCIFTLANDTAGAGTTLNLSPSTWQMKINGGASVATYTLPKGYQAKFSVDAAGALWDVDVTQITPGGFVQTLNVTTDQTITAGASLTAIPGLSFTMPASMAVNVPFSCHLLYSQATTAASDSFGIQDVTVAPTSLMAKAQAYISASTFTAGNLPALTTTTATAIVTFTPSAATTVWNADIDGFIEQPSNASTSVVQIMAQFTTNNGTIKRGSFCTVGVPK